MGNRLIAIVLSGVVGLLLLVGAASLSAQQPEDVASLKHYDKNRDGQLDAKEIEAMKCAVEQFNHAAKMPQPPRPTAHIEKGAPGTHPQFATGAFPSDDPMRHLRDAIASLSAFYKDTKQFDKFEFMQHKALEAEVRFATAYTYILQGDYDRARGELLSVLRNPTDPREEQMMHIKAQLDELQQHDLKLGIEENRIRAERMAVRERMEQLSRQAKEFEGPQRKAEKPREERREERGERPREMPEQAERLKNEIRELDETGKKLRRKTDEIREALESKKVKGDEARELKENLGRLEEEIVRMKEEVRRRRDQVAEMKARSEKEDRPRKERGEAPFEVREKAERMKKEIQELEQHGKQVWREIEEINETLKSKKIGKDRAAELEEHRAQLQKKIRQIKNEINQRKENLEKMEREFKDQEKQPREEKRHMALMTI